ncbi:MAG: hypothetical protein AAF202_13145, partial [Pseudomonadota bacterium]
MPTLDRFLEEFLSFEQSSQVRGITDHGAPVWEIFRYQVFLKVAQKRGLLQDIGVSLADGKVSRLASMAAQALRNSMGHNAFLAPQADYLIWGHNRRKKEADGQYWDLYVDPILETLGVENTVVMEPPFANPLHFQPAKTPRLYYLDPLYLLSVVGSKASDFVLDLQQIRSLALIRSSVAECFGQDGPEIGFYKERYSRFVIQKSLWQRILKRVEPKAVFMVRAEGNEGLIAAARESQIPTIELQHGSPSAKKVNYDFGDRPKQLGADHFFAFGRFWRDLDFWARPKESIHVLGYPYLERYRR